jgi:hypothetical protein
MLAVFTRFLDWISGCAISAKRGLALEKNRLRAFRDRLSVDNENGNRKGIVKARAAPRRSMVNRGKGRGMG